jgi:phage baseplate assembly protein V
MKALEKLWRRIAMTLGLSHVTMAIENQTVQLLQISLMGGAVDRVPSLQLFGFASSPQPGCDALIVFLEGDRSKGVVISTNDQRYRPQNMLPGEAMIFDAFGKSVYLTKSGGIVIQCNGANVTVADCGTFAVQGNITATGEITRGVGGSDSVTLGGHKHNQPADSHGDTEQPTNSPTAGT